MKKLGYTLLSLPFVALIIYTGVELGWRLAAIMWGIVIGSTACIFGGMTLIVNGDEDER